MYAQFLLAMYTLQLRHSLEGPARDAALPNQIDGSDERHPLVIIYTAAIKHKLPEAIAYLQQLFTLLENDQFGNWIDWESINKVEVDKYLIDSYDRAVRLYLAHYRS